MYVGTSSAVQLDNNTTSDSFPTTTGVLLGDTLAPFLFVIVVDYVLRKVFSDSSLAFEVASGNSIKVGALAYADDIANISPDPPTAQQLLNKQGDLIYLPGLGGVRIQSCLHRSQETRLGCLCKATVESVLLYGLEALTISKTLAKEIDGAHSSLLRYALGIHWPQRLSNVDLHQRANSTRCTQIIRSRRL